MRLLHITAHLGGGVGKVLSRLVEISARRKDGIHHTIACLEMPEKSQFAEHVCKYGGNLLLCPSQAELAYHIEASDIVQLEWWHHPVVMQCLASGPLPAMRLVVWSHISGLYIPSLPADFLGIPSRFLFSTPSSWSLPSLSSLSEDTHKRIATVFSSGGFEDLPPPIDQLREGNLRVGYLGSLNFAKLHPQLLDFIAAVDLPDFRLSLVGDPITAERLLEEAQQRGLAERLNLRGYQTNVQAELANFDVLAYLLNPLHYGSTENALLEAMAMGVVPVVLDNPAELHLVKNGETGLIVDSPTSFSCALNQLAKYPEKRQQLSKNASQEIRRRFSAEHTSDQLLIHYLSVIQEPKRSIDLRFVFGETPAEWCQTGLGPERWRFRDDGSVDLSGNPPHVLFEQTKGSVFHYQRYFPDDARLAAWAKGLAAWA